MTKRRLSWSDRLRRRLALFAGLLWLGCAGPLAAAGAATHSRAPVKKGVAGKVAQKPAKPSPEPQIGAAEIVDSETMGLNGAASFYGPGFHGRRTATGEVFDAGTFSAATNRFPLGTWVAVRRLDNDRCAIVKVNDRMHVKHRRRIIDVSRGVAEYLDMVNAGVVMVRVAPIKDRQRDGSSCHGAFAPDAAAAEVPDVSGWRNPQN